MKLDANVHPNLSDALRNLTRLQLENVAVRLDSFKEMAAGPFVLMDNLNTLELQIVKFKSGGGRRYASVFPKKLELTELKLNCVKGLHKYTNFWNAYSRGCKNLRHLSVTACPDIPPITTIMSQDNVKNIVLFSWPGLFDGMSVDEFMGHIGKLANCEDMERICDLPRLIEPMDVDDEDVIKMCKPMEALKVSFRWKLLEMFMTKWRERPMRFVPAVCTYVLPYQPYNQEARRLKVDALIRASEFSDALNECKLCEKWWGRDIYTRDLKLTCYIGLGNLVKVQKIIKRDLPKMVDVPLASRLDKHLWPPLEAIFRDYFQSSYQTQARERRNATLNTVMLHPSHMFQ